MGVSHFLSPFLRERGRKGEGRGREGERERDRETERQRQREHLILYSYFTLRPLLVIAGSFDQDQIAMGGFQEWPQVTNSHTNINLHLQHVKIY